MAAVSKHPSLKESVLFPTDDDFDRTLWNNSQTDIWPQLRKLEVKYFVRLNFPFFLTHQIT